MDAVASGLQKRGPSRASRETTPSLARASGMPFVSSLRSSQKSRLHPLAQGLSRAARLGPGLRPPPMLGFADSFASRSPMAIGALANESAACACRRAPPDAGPLTAAAELLAGGLPKIRAISTVLFPSRL